MKKILKVIAGIAFFSSVSFAMVPQQSSVDCIVLKEENSIICKYSHKRVNKDKTIRFEWIEPDGTISRIRDMIIPAGHGSIYDYRFIKGRTNGTWTFKAIDEDMEYSTTFDIK